MLCRWQPRWIAVMVPLIAWLCACESDQPLRVGFVGGLSGRVADLGNDGRNGALLAVAAFNQAGGIRHRPVQLLVRDDAQDPDTMTDAVEELAAASVVAIIGPMTSSMAMVARPVAERHGLLMLSPTVTTASLSGRDDNFLRVSSDNLAYASFSARRLLETSGKMRLAACLDLGNHAYTGGWLDVFTDEYTKRGGEIVARVAFTSNADTEHAAVIEQMRAGNPDGLLFVAGAVDTARLAHEAKKQAPDLRLIAVEWSATEALIELGGRAVEGLTLSSFFDRDSEAPAYLKFKRAFIERFGREPGFGGTAAYDATYALLSALKDSSADSDLKQVLLATGEYPGLQQPVKFDRFGDAQRDIFLTRIENGRYVVVRQ
jgi:branched-chain amino acid transport system substrate-binding protein